MEHFTSESLLFKRAPELMRISEFMHDITHPGLIKRLNDNIPKTVYEMISVTKDFIRGEKAVRHQKQEIKTSTRISIGQMDNKDDCLHLKRPIEEVVKFGQLAHQVKEIKQGNNKASTSKPKKPDSTPKDKGVAIFMVHS
ncbi:hypothetical protein Tco_0962091 [Tanacetum coccineum]